MLVRPEDRPPRQAHKPPFCLLLLLYIFLNLTSFILPFLLIRPDEFGLRQDVPLHCLFELRLAWPAEVGKDGVESEELVEVAVAADRRAWPSIARPLPVVQSLARAGGQRLRSTASASWLAVGGRL